MSIYKIFESRVGHPYTLFHGLEGSRQLPLGEWLAAEKKRVTNGSRTTHYTSGFHCYPTLEAVYRWLRGATKLDGRYVVKVLADQCRDKPRAVRPTILADWLYIPVEEWSLRVPAEIFMAQFEEFSEESYLAALRG